MLYQSDCLLTCRAALFVCSASFQSRAVGLGKDPHPCNNMHRPRWAVGMYPAPSRAPAKDSMHANSHETVL